MLLNKMSLNKVAAACTLIFMTCGIVGAQTLGETVAARTRVPGDVQLAGTDSLSNTSNSYPGGVTVLPGVTYSILSGYRELKFDLYLPPAQFKAKGPRPLLVYIHGGGWAGGSDRMGSPYFDWPSILANIAEQGYVVASIEYRLSGEAAFPAQLQDIKSAIRWLRVNAGKYNIDPNRVMTWGRSAGGHLSAMAAVSCNVTSFAPSPRAAAAGHAAQDTQASAPVGFDEASDCVRGAVTWFGVFDLTKLAIDSSNPLVNQLIGCGTVTPCSAEKFMNKMTAASPVTYVTDKTPPIFIMHGTDDTTVPIAQSQEFYDLLKSKGVKTEFIKVPGVGHSWTGKTPETTRAACLLALQKSLDFIDATIGDKTGK